MFCGLLSHMHFILHTPMLSFQIINDKLYRKHEKNLITVVAQIIMTQHSRYGLKKERITRFSLWDMNAIS